MERVLCNINFTSYGLHHHFLYGGDRGWMRAMVNVSWRKTTSFKRGGDVPVMKKSLLHPASWKNYQLVSKLSFLIKLVEKVVVVWKISEERTVWNFFSQAVIPWSYRSLFLITCDETRMGEIWPPILWSMRDLQHHWLQYPSKLSPGIQNVIYDVTMVLSFLWDWLLSHWWWEIEVKSESLSLWSP